MQTQPSNVLSPVAIAKGYRIWKVEIPWFLAHCRRFYPELERFTEKRNEQQMLSVLGDIVAFGSSNGNDVKYLDQAYEDIERARGDWHGTDFHGMRRLPQFSIPFVDPRPSGYLKVSSIRFYGPEWMAADFEERPIHCWTAVCWLDIQKPWIIEGHSYRHICDVIDMARIHWKHRVTILQPRMLY